MTDYDLDRFLVQVRRIEEHREKGAEKEIRKTYQELLKELRHYLADTYTQYAEDDALTYGILQKHSAYARFLEEVERKINDISPEVKRLIRSTVDQTYEYTYNGMIDCVKKAGIDPVVMAGLKACTPDVIRQAVENPVSKLTLNDRLEKHRKEIIYDIKQDISVGLMNGDRYSTMANRIKKSVDGDYKKAIRIARTETHRVREAGNHDAARSADEVLKTGESGMRMAKTWKTMKDERVRPAKAKGKSRKYDHRKMDGITVLADEEFVLPSGAKTMAPGQSGVASEDINCRCYLSYGLQKVEKPKLLDGQALKLPDEVMDIEGMTEDVRIEIEKSIEILQKRYTIKLGEVSVEAMSGKDANTIMLAGPYIENGELRMGLVINKNLNYHEISRKMHQQYEAGIFAGKSIGDYVAHEMAHIMTFQDCGTLEGYYELRDKLNKQFVPGISKYADKTKLGSESLAEAFVRYRNGEKIPLKAKLQVRKYIERWKKQ